MTQPIDEAFVDIRPDVDDFARDLRRGLDRAFAGLRRDAEHAADGVERSFKDAADDTERHLRSIGSAVSKEATSQRRAWREVADSLALDMKVGTKVATRAVDDLADDAGRDLARIERDAHQASRAVAGIGARAQLTGLGDIASGLRNIRTVLPITLIVSALPTIVSALVALGGTLVDLTGLLGLLPGLFSVVVAAAAPLVLAFQGIGDAVAAIAEGDPEKIKEALAGLAPAARTFVGEIGALLPVLRQLGDAVQEAFFRPLRGVLTQVVRALLPTLTAGLSTVADALGQFFAAFGRTVAEPRNIAVIGEVFAATGRIIAAAGPVILRFVDALFGTVGAGLPFVERAFAAFNRGLTAFTDLINRAVASGGFDRFIEDSFDALKALGELTGSLFRFIGALFGDAGDEGNDFIRMLAGLVDGMTAFLRSAEGQEALQNLLDGLPATVAALSALLAVLGFLVIVGSKLQNLPRNIVEAGERLAPVLGDILGGIGERLAAVGRFFTGLPDRIMTGLRALPGLVAAVFVDLFDRVTFAIGFGVGTVIRFFIELPGRVLAAVQALPGLVASLFGLARDAAVGLAQSLADRVVSFFASLPGRAESAVRSLPDRILGLLRSLASAAFGIGRDIIDGLIRGIQSAVGAAVATVRRAVGNILDGAKRGLGIGSPSKVFADEVGAQIPAGIAVGVRSGTPDLAAMVAAAAGSLIPAAPPPAGGLSMAGGITVELHFHAPVSEPEARAAGSAAADGLLSRLSTFTRRDVRLAVRTL